MKRSSDFEHVATIVQLIHEHARATPARIALDVAGGSGLTYQAVDERARRLAAGLRRHCAAAQRALLLCPSGADFVLGLLGCFAAGVTAVPLPVANSARVGRSLRRLQPIAQNARPSLLLTTEAIRAASATALEELANSLGIPILTIEEAAESEALPSAECACDRAAAAFLQYTSGSTGAPKGVVNTHHALLENFQFLRCLSKNHAETVVVNWMPLFHDMGLIMGVLQPLAYGNRAVLMAPSQFVASPLDWLKVASARRGTVLPGPNFAFELLVTHFDERLARQLDLSSIEAMVPAAEPVLPRTLINLMAAYGPFGLRDTAIKPSYGLAEATLIGAGSARDVPPTVVYIDKAALLQDRVVETSPFDPNARGSVACGEDFGGQRLSIVDPGTHTELPEGRVGEIWISGTSIGPGYFEQPEANAETFQARVLDERGEESARTFLRTGDLGFLLRGQLHISGRVKDMMIFSGQCHYPNDIEQTISDMGPPVVAGSGAAFSQTQDGVEQLVVVQEVVRREGQSEDELRALCAQVRHAVSAEHGIAPRAVVLIRKGTLPKTTSGKVRRKETRRAWLAQQLAVLSERHFEVAEPQVSSLRSELEQLPSHRRSARLVEVVRAEVATVIGSSAPSALPLDVGFFDLGMDSLGATRLAAALRRALGIPLLDHSAFDNPTIAQLAGHLARTLGDASEHQPAEEQASLLDEPIAIVGIGCRFPGEGGQDVHGADAFFEQLLGGYSAIRGIPDERGRSQLDIPGFGSFLNQVDRFDAPFFGITAREAISLDPQQRILLETTWHALEHAGIDPLSLRGSKTAVYVGLGTLDYSHLPFASSDGGAFDLYYGTGNAAAAAAGRIAYVLGLEGEAISLDTACSSSLVAVHFACQSLRLGESSLALAGGVKLQLLPEIDLALHRAGMLAADGRCKTFDATADGYVRGEGAGIVALMRLRDALAAGRRPLAVLRATVVRQDGARSGLAVPDGKAQAKLLRTGLKRARLEPDDIDYVEVHGTGTRVGDPIEYGAVADVYASSKRATPLHLGSVKTNIGHLEAAAGIAGLIKAVLAVERGELPPHLNLQQLHGDIDLDRIPAVIPKQAVRFGGRAPRRAGVMSYGFTGTIAHAVVEQAAVASERPSPSSLPAVLTLSARSEASLSILAEQYAGLLESRPERAAALAATATRARAHLEYRRALVIHEPSRAANELRTSVKGRRPRRTMPKVALLFTGQGAQRVGMVSELYERLPSFRPHFDRADQALLPHLGRPLSSILCDSSALAEPEWLQPATFAVGYALGMTWRELGLEPAVVVGHSIGEFAAAVVAGALSLEGAARLIAARGRLMGGLLNRGTMVAVRMDADRALGYLGGAQELALAACNGPQDSVIAGNAAELDALIERLSRDGISTRLLTVSHAFHSPLVDPILPALQDAAQGLVPGVLCCDFYSTADDAFVGAERLCEPAYWGSHARQSVRFLQAVRACRERGCEVFLEVGPAPVLAPLTRRCLPAEDTSEVLSSLRQDTGELESFFGAAAALYERGQNLDWKAINGEATLDPRELPVYPFERQSYWFELERGEARPRQVDGTTRPAAWLELQWQPVDLLLASGGEPSSPALVVSTLEGRDPSELAARPCIAYVAGLELATDPSARADRAIADLVALGQAIAVGERKVRLGVVTRGAFAVADGGATQPASAMLWGAARTLAIECPKVEVFLYDLDMALPVEPALARYVEALPRLARTLDQLAVRGDTHYSPRLRAAELQQSTYTVSPDGCYLIVGAFGALGGMVARWLAGRGARELVLLSRSEPAARGRALVAELEKGGVVVHVALTDVCDREGVRACIDAIVERSAAGGRVLRGVVHCAGVARFNALANQNDTDYRAVVWPKTHGSLNLHLALGDLKLDWLLLFSSIAGIWGSRFQLDYAASNTFQDSLAQLRRSQGKPTLAISWGPWGGGAGMSEVDDSLLAFLEGAGVRRLEPRHYLSALETALGSGLPSRSAHGLCASVDFARFAPLYELYSGTPLLESCVRPESPGRTLATATELSSLPEQEREAAAVRLVTELLAEVLRMESPRLSADADLILLGLDSILVMDFVRRLNARVGVTLALRAVFERPQVRAIAQALLERLPTAVTVVATEPVFRLRSDGAAAGQPFPLTELQYAYWAGRAGAFALGNVACHAYLETQRVDLDIDAVERCWNFLVRRHDALRIVVDADGQQRILQDVPEVRVARLDLRDLDASSAQARLLEIREEMSHQVLPSDRFPLFDLRATHLSDGVTRFHFSIDMLINDATSSQVLWEELNALLLAGGEPGAAGLSPLTVSFRDYVLGRLDPASGYVAERDRAQAYWRERMAQLPKAPQLPLARRPEELLAPKFQRLLGRISAADWRRAKRQAAERGLTPASLLLTAFAEVLAAFSAEPRFTLNLTIFDRRPWHEDVARMVGDFSALTLLSVDFGTAQTVREHAQALHRRMLEDLEHRAYSAVDVLREMNRERPGQRLAMPVVFTSQLGLSEPTKGATRDTPLGEVVHGITQTPQVWLDHQVSELEGALLFNWDAVEGLFPEGLLEAMFDAYRRLVERLCRDPASWEEPFSAPLSAQQRAVRERVNATSAPLSEQSLHGLFLETARRTPDALALLSADGRRWSYAELERWSRELAGALLDAGCPDQARVAVLMDKSPEQAASCLAILRAGGVYVPLDPSWPVARLRGIVEQGAIFGAIAGPGCGHEQRDLFSSRALAVVDARARGSRPPSDVSTPEALAYVIYTSGSTGTPKGVLIDHRGPVNTVLDVNRRFEIGASDRVLGLSALSFDLSVYDLFGTFAAGGAIVIPDAAGRRDPTHWAQLITAHGITVWNSVPALLEMLVEAGQSAALLQLRRILLSGDWMPLRLAERVRSEHPRARLVVMGGATEASIWSNWFEVQGVETGWTSIPYGFPLTNQRYFVLDEQRRDRPDWVGGDLYIGGVGLAVGYDNDEARTHAAFVTHPATKERIYRTGDRARYWPDGTLEFLGRLDNQVKVGGYRIELGEIEAKLSAIPGVRAAVADAVRQGEGVAAPRKLFAWVVAERSAPSSLLPSRGVPALESHGWRDRVEEALAGPGPISADNEALHELLSAAAAQAIRDSLRELGVFATVGERRGFDELCVAVGVTSEQQPVLRSWLERLTRLNELAQEGEVFQAASPLRHEPWSALAARAEALGIASNMIDALAAMGPGRADVLTGKRGALEVLYADADGPLSPDKLWLAAPGARPALRRVGDALRSLLEARPEGTLRVLELGARGGETTLAWLEGLPHERLNITVTDTSPLLLNVARSRLEAREVNATYCVHDPDLSPLDQGLEAHGFDVVVACNALHRSRDLPATAAGVRRLLDASGVLLALEATQIQPINCVTVDLLNVVSERRDMRAGSPLLRAEQWLTLLHEAGFEGTRAYATESPGLDWLVAQQTNVVHAFDPKALLESLASALPSYMLPHRIFLVDTLPLTATGKVARDRLPRPDLLGQKMVAPVASLPVEVAELGAIWRELLPGAEVNSSSTFFDLGGDSLTAVRLTELVRQRLGVTVPVRTVFEHPSLSALAAVVASRSCTSTPAEQLPELEPLPESRHEPFPLTDVQQAYFIGRDPSFALGGVATHLYVEIDVEALPLERLEAAWNQLIRRHDMLRAVIDEDGVQRVLESTPRYRFARFDCSDGDEEEVASVTARVRSELSHRVAETHVWPLFEVRACVLPRARGRLFISLDNLICDGRSMQVLLAEWAQLARSPEAELPDVAATFRDWVLAAARAETTAGWRRSLDYWLERLPFLPPAPRLPLLAVPGHSPRFVRRARVLDVTAWDALKRAASRHHLTPNAVLLTAYGLALGEQCAEPAFTLNLTLFHRPPVHPHIDRVVGDFTTLVLLACNLEQPRSFVEHARTMQSNVARDIEHSQVSAVRVLREADRRSGRVGGHQYPVVFTSGLGVGDAQGRVTPPLGTIGWGITQTPQVHIDHQVVEVEGALHFNWDAVESLFEPDLLDAAFEGYCRLLVALAESDEAWQTSVFVPGRRASEIPVSGPRPAPASVAITGFTTEEVERLLVRLVSSETKGAVDAHHNFLDAGATSLNLVRVCRKLEAELGRVVGVQAFFEHASARALARYLTRSPSEPERTSPTDAASGTSRAARRKAAGRKTRGEAAE